MSYEFELFWSGKTVEYIVSIESLMDAGHSREEAEFILEEMRILVMIDFNIEEWWDQYKWLRGGAHE